MVKYVEVVPAYGRDYKSQAAVKADWKANKDFSVVDYGPNYGRATNKEDCDQMDVKVMVRYDRLTKVVQVK